MALLAQVSVRSVPDDAGRHGSAGVQRSRQGQGPFRSVGQVGLMERRSRECRGHGGCRGRLDRAA